jgi:hypothetical protein
MAILCFRFGEDLHPPQLRRLHLSCAEFLASDQARSIKLICQQQLNADAENADVEILAFPVFTVSLIFDCAGQAVAICIIISISRERYHLSFI